MGTCRAPGRALTAGPDTATADITPTTVTAVARVSTRSASTPAICPSTLCTTSSVESCRTSVSQIGINSSNLPIYTVYNVISGILSHVTQTGYNSYGQPTYSSTDQFGSPISG